jgi:hypothetical protein
VAGASRLRATLVDQSVLAFVPEFYRAEEVLSSGLHTNPDSLVYFANGFEHALAGEVAVETGLKRVYEVPGTQIRTATNPFGRQGKFGV